MKRKFINKENMKNLKKEEAIHNSEIKRGKKKRRGNETIHAWDCGCCFSIDGWDSKKKIKKKT